MRNLPAHMLPRFTPEAKEDALFHYTTSSGLIGMFESNELWATAYYCANDESELETGSGILSPLFRKFTHELIEAKDQCVDIFSGRGVNMFEYASGFERQITSLTFSSLCAYITCFCKPTGEEDFQHGLLSQWRGYGTDGGYALQFSRKKLISTIGHTKAVADVNFDLEDVHYQSENPLKSLVLNHTKEFVDEYKKFPDEMADPLDSGRTTRRNPIVGLLEGPLDCLLGYLSDTKDRHFAEERECRLSLIQPTSVVAGARPIRRFNRNGLVVSYATTPKETFDVLGCIEWVIVGPGPRMAARFKAIQELIRQTNRDIKVRLSHIPFTRS